MGMKCYPTSWPKENYKHICMNEIYTLLNGACRTAAGKGGKYKRYDPADVSMTQRQCAEMCAKDNVCKAYEFTIQYGCEIHTAVITKAQPLAFFAECGIKKVNTASESDVASIEDNNRKLKAANEELRTILRSFAN